MRTWIDASDDEIRLSTSIGTLIDFDPDVYRFIFDEQTPTLRSRAGILRDDAWRFDDMVQVQIRVALDIWSGSGHLFLFEMLEQWGRDDWIKFIRAICVLKSIALSDVEASTINELQSLF